MLYLDYLNSSVMRGWNEKYPYSSQICELCKNCCHQNLSKIAQSGRTGIQLITCKSCLPCFDDRMLKTTLPFQISDHVNLNFIFYIRLYLDCGWGGLYSRTLFIYKYESLRGFIKGVSGGCFIQINDVTHNPPLPKIRVRCYKSRSVIKWSLSFFKSGPFPASFYLFSSFQYSW